MQAQVLAIVGGLLHKMDHGSSGSCTNSSYVNEDVLKGYVSSLGADYFKEDDKEINDGYPVLHWE